MTSRAARHGTTATAALAAALSGAAPAFADCPPTAAGVEQPARAQSGAELRLEDGRVVRLAGIVVVPAAEADARRVLDGALAGRAVRIAPLRAEPDRYGRVVARVWGGGAWLERTLVAAGVALATAAPGEADCIAALVAAEREARAARAGAWAAGEGGPMLAADDREALGRRRGRFALVEGTVASVGVRDYATFLNFGRRWTESLAVSISRRDRAAIEAVHGPLAELRGRRVVVRGVVDPGERPRMAVARAEAVEVLDAAR